METMRKYIIPFLLLILASSFVLFGYYNSKKVSDIPTNQQSGYEAKVNIAIDFGNKKVMSDELVADANDTAFSILKKFAEKDNIKLETTQYDFGVFVKKIDEFESSAKKSWIYYVNGESGQVAADQMKLKNGDKIEWKYETPK